MLKTIETEVRICDMCKTAEGVIKRTLFDGKGYQPGIDDPLAQKFRNLFREFDLCDECMRLVLQEGNSYSSPYRQNIISIKVIERWIGGQGNIYGDIPQKPLG